MPGFERRSLIKNAASMYALQALNILVPAFSFPYIVRMIGVDGFGTYTYAVSIVQLGVFLTEYGFGMTATRRIAVAKGVSSEAVSEEFSVTVVLKGCLMVVAAVVLAAVVAVVPGLRSQALLYAALAPMLVGEVLFPVWLLQGLEQMQYLPFFSLISRGASLALLLLLVDGPEDVVIVGITQSMPFVLNGLMALWIARSKLGVRFVPVQPASVFRAAFGEASKAFVSRLAAQVYVRGSLPLLGSLASAEQVGIYSIVQRIGALITAVVVQPLAQSLYPQLCRQWEEDPLLLASARRKLVLLGGAGLVLALGLLNLLAAPVVTLITGEPSPETVHLVHYYWPVIAFSALNSLLATVLMAMQKFADLSRAVVVGTFVFVLSALPLVYAYEAMGMVLANTLVETSVFGLFFYLTRVTKRSSVEV